ncbi:MAG TPA: GNAT family N-acetyltransferase [Spirochaetota bacterium]|nr:GNAT family N-acetyltransferase [Spirochaetota bacterium]
MTPLIHKIKDTIQLKTYHNIIRLSFKTVADHFGLNEINSPSNPAFISIEKLEDLMQKAQCFGVIENDIPCGFFAIEFAQKARSSYLERLCIVPEKRHNGYGKSILDFAVKYASAAGSDKISIGIMNKNQILKNWYIDYGFNEVSIKKFPHIPFDVCFLDFYLK